MNVCLENYLTFQECIANIMEFCMPCIYHQAKKNLCNTTKCANKVNSKGNSICLTNEWRHNWSKIVNQINHVGYKITRRSITKTFTVLLSSLIALLQSSSTLSQSLQTNQTQQKHSFKIIFELLLHKIT